MNLIKFNTHSSTLNNIEEGKFITQSINLKIISNLMVKLEGFSLNSGTKKSTRSHHFYFTLLEVLRNAIRHTYT